MMKKGENPVAECVLELYAISASARYLFHSCGLWFANSWMYYLSVRFVRSVCPSVCG